MRACISNAGARVEFISIVAPAHCINTGMTDTQASGNPGCPFTGHGTGDGTGNDRARSTGNPRPVDDHVEAPLDETAPRDSMPAPEDDGAGPPVLLLTGASRGIGHATVKLFQERGWRVLTVSRQEFSPLCQWRAAGDGHIQADLSDLDAIPDLVAAVRGCLGNGRLHALVNNAGISPKGPQGERLGLMRSDAALWTQVLNVNLVSTALLARALMPELERAGGAIVNVTSIAGSRVHPFAGVAYAASKAALAALTREMAHEFGGRGVRANAIAPGEIDTSILSKGTDTLVANGVPMRRLGNPMEVAETIYFLCMSASSYVNGSEIHINGGQHV